MKTLLEKRERARELRKQKAVVRARERKQLQESRVIQGDLLSIAERCEQNSLDLLCSPEVIKFTEAQLKFAEAQLKDQRKKLKAEIQEAERKFNNVNEELRTVSALKKMLQRDNELTESDTGTED